MFIEKTVKVELSQSTLTFEYPYVSGHYPRFMVYREATIVASRRAIAYVHKPHSPGEGCTWDLQPRVDGMQPLKLDELEAIIAQAKELV